MLHRVKLTYPLWLEYIAIIGLVVVIIIGFLEKDKGEDSFQVKGVYFRKKYLVFPIVFMMLGFCVSSIVYSRIYTPIVQKELGLINEYEAIYFRHAKVIKATGPIKRRTYSSVLIQFLDGTESKVICDVNEDEIEVGQVYEAYFSSDLYTLLHFEKLPEKTYISNVEEVQKKDLELLEQYKKARTFYQKNMALCVIGFGMVGVVIVGITSVQKTLKEKRRKHTRRNVQK